MKIFKIYPVFILLIALVSCQSKKSTSESMKVSEDKMIEEGFKRATVIYSPVPGDCMYTLAVEGESNLFDPTNMEAKYQKSQMKIWVKYTPLRMPNRCEKAMPVEITGIHSRK